MEITQSMILDLISDAVFSILFPVFYANILSIRTKKWIYIFTMAAIFMIMSPIVYVARLPQFVIFSLGIGINLAGNIFFAADGFLKKTLYTFIPHAADIVVSLIYVSLRTLLMPGWQPTFGGGVFADALEMVIIIMELTLALFLISKIIQRKKPKVGDLTAIYLLSIMIVQIFISTFLMYIYYTNISFGIFCTAMIIYMSISIAMALAVIAYSVRINREQSRQELIVNQYRLMNMQYAQLRNSYISYKKLRHDLKEHINVIHGLALKGETDELKDYTNELTQNWESLSAKTFCDVPAVDIVIADKYNIASLNGIRTDFKISGIKESNADYVYLCSIFSNILNNALEAAMHCNTNPYITLRCGIVMKNLVITCHNSMAEYDYEKDNTQEHGYGLRIINDSAKLLDGNFVYEHDDKSFTSIVTIPMKGTEEK